MLISFSSFGGVLSFLGLKFVWFLRRKDLWCINWLAFFFLKIEVYIYSYLGSKLILLDTMDVLDT